MTNKHDLLKKKEKKSCVSNMYESSNLVLGIVKMMPLDSKTLV